MTYLLRNKVSTMKACTVMCGTAPLFATINSPSETLPQAYSSARCPLGQQLFTLPDEHDAATSLLRIPRVSVVICVRAPSSEELPLASFSHFRSFAYRARQPPIPGRSCAIRGHGQLSKVESPFRLHQ